MITERQLLHMLLDEMLDTGERNGTATMMETVIGGVMRKNYTIRVECQKKVLPW